MFFSYLGQVSAEISASSEGVTSASSFRGRLKSEDINSHSSAFWDFTLRALVQLGDHSQPFVASIFLWDDQAPTSFVLHFRRCGRLRQNITFSNLPRNSSIPQIQVVTTRRQEVFRKPSVIPTNAIFIFFLIIYKWCCNAATEMYDTDMDGVQRFWAPLGPASKNYFIQAHKNTSSSRMKRPLDIKNSNNYDKLLWILLNLSLFLFY